MKHLKRILKGLLFATGSLIILTFLITLLNYFDIIGNKFINIAKIIIPLFALALGGYVMGKEAKQNGWIEGLKLGLIMAILIMVFNLIFVNVTLKNFIFYALLLISAVFGSMFGINMKKES